MPQQLWNQPCFNWNQLHIHWTHLWVKVKVPWGWVKIKERWLLNLPRVTQCFTFSIYEISPNADAVYTTGNKYVIWPQTVFCSVGEMFPVTRLSFIVLDILGKKIIRSTKPRRHSLVEMLGGLHPTSHTVDKAGALAPPIVQRFV